MAFGQNVVNIVINAQDRFSATFAKAKKGIGDFRKSALGMGIAGGLMAMGLTKAVEASNKVETGFAKVQTLMETGQNAQKTFGEFVKKTNIVLGDQGDQVSVLNGLYQTISAGITNTADAEKFMGLAAKTAVGGHAQLSNVIEAGTKTMAAFGIKMKDAKKTFDGFSATVKAGQTTMEQLAQAFPTVAGTAGAMGAKLNETEGVFAALTKVMASPENAAVALNAIFTKLISPTEDMKVAIKKLGYENGKAMIKTLGIMGTLKALGGTVGNSVIKMGHMFKNVRAIRAVFPLMGGAAEDAAKSIEITTDSAGLMNKQFKDVANTTEHRWGAALSNLQNIQTSFGNQIKEVLSPIIEKLTRGIVILAHWWNNLSAPMKQAIVVFTLVTTGILVMAAAVAILTAVFSPWLLIMGAIILVITAIILIIINWKKIMASMAKFAMKVGMEMILFFQRFADVWKIIWAGVENVFISVWNHIVDFYQLQINTIIKGINNMISYINKIPGINIPIIPKVDFSRIKGQMTDIGQLTAKLETGRLARRATAEANLKRVNVYIDKVYGTDPDELSTALQHKLNNKILT